MASLKEIQEAMVNLWSSNNHFEAYVQSGLLQGPNGELLNGVDPSRLKVYYQDILSRRMNTARNTFPLTMKVLGKNARALVENYWKTHSSTGYNPILEFNKFPEFLRNECADMIQFPFLANLAEYEWMRLCVQLSEKEMEHGNVPGADSAWLNSRPVINSTLQIKYFDYEAHFLASRVAASRWRKSKFEPVASYLAMYQDPSDRLNVRVQELGEHGFRLMQLALPNVRSYGELIEQFVELSPELSTVESRELAVEMIAQLNDCEIFLGVAQLEGT